MPVRFQDGSFESSHSISMHCLHCEETNHNDRPGSIPPLLPDRWWNLQIQWIYTHLEMLLYLEPIIVLHPGENYHVTLLQYLDFFQLQEKILILETVPEGYLPIVQLQLYHCFQKIENAE